MKTSDLFACFGDVIELDFPRWKTKDVIKILDDHSEWKQYNPRKKIPRYGLSVTSLDGGYSGVPDLDSLYLYNKEYQVTYTDKDFKVRTDISNRIPHLKDTLDYFGENLCRSHFLRLDSGGFFPPHRDSGYSIPSSYIRVIVPLVDFTSRELVWILDGKILNLKSGHAYCINTTKEHSVFSFRDNIYMLVLNIVATPESLQVISNNLKIR
jgi:hypothetical protein